MLASRLAPSLPRLGLFTEVSSRISSFIPLGPLAGSYCSRGVAGSLLVILITPRVRDVVTLVGRSAGLRMCER
jgi:hypothetical protein